MFSKNFPIGIHGIFREILFDNFFFDLGSKKRNVQTNDANYQPELIPGTWTEIIKNTMVKQLHLTSFYLVYQGVFIAAKNTSVLEKYERRSIISPQFPR